MKTTNILPRENYPLYGINTHSSIFNLGYIICFLLQSVSLFFPTDSVLVGLQDEMAMSPSLQGSLRFRAGSSVSNLCFSHMDDDIACEPDIIGHIRLINSSAVIVVEPSIAMVTIEDDDRKFAYLSA